MYKTFWKLFVRQTWYILTTYGVCDIVILCLIVLQLFCKWKFYEDYILPDKICIWLDCAFSRFDNIYYWRFIRLILFIEVSISVGVVIYLCAGLYIFIMRDIALAHVMRMHFTRNDSLE